MTGPGPAGAGVGVDDPAPSTMPGDHLIQEHAGVKLPSSIRNLSLVAFLAVFAAGCDGNAAQPWHYWIAFAIFGGALFVVLVAMPLGYYVKVWRLKHRGRRSQ
jgi:hypothetical protein